MADTDPPTLRSSRHPSPEPPSAEPEPLASDPPPSAGPALLEAIVRLEVIVRVRPIIE